MTLACSFRINSDDFCIGAISKTSFVLNFVVKCFILKGEVK